MAEAGSGGGAGLAIAKELIEAIGGALAVQLVINDVSAFASRLPLAAKIAANGAKLNGVSVSIPGWARAGL